MELGAAGDNHFLKYTPVPSADAETDAGACEYTDKGFERLYLV